MATTVTRYDVPLLPALIMMGIWNAIPYLFGWSMTGIAIWLVLTCLPVSHFATRIRSRDLTIMLATQIIVTVIVFELVQ